MVQKTPFSLALADHQISADLIDVDLYRIHGGILVETDYIIRVASKNSDESFEPFTLSKTFRQFRSFAKKLKAIADGAFGGSRQRKNATADENTMNLGRYCETIHHLIKSEPNQYIGKVSKRYDYIFLSFLNTIGPIINGNSLASFTLCSFLGQLQICKGPGQKTQSHHPGNFRRYNSLLSHKNGGKSIRF